MATLLATPAALAGPATEKEAAFVTWESMEPDKCASIWLIKRHIATNARFLFHKPEETPPPGIPFDTPEAAFRRLHNKSTYETLLEGYGIADPRAARIGRVMHDIEINLWARKALPETRRIESELSELLADSTPEAALELCLSYFDRLELEASP